LLVKGTILTIESSLTLFTLLDGKHF